METDVDADMARTGGFLRCRGCQPVNTVRCVDVYLLSVDLRDGVRDTEFVDALYRDFPDEVRVRGDERF